MELEYWIPVNEDVGPASITTGGTGYINVIMWLLLLLADTAVLLEVREV